MEMNKISVQEYLENKDLLQHASYISYADKVTIIDAIMKQVYTVYDGNFMLDSVLLDRVKHQIYIENCTNLSLRELDEYGFDGYDLLKKENCFEEVLDFIKDEINDFEHILALRCEDFFRDRDSVKGVLTYKIDALFDHIESFIPVIVNSIERIDEKSMISTLSNILDNFIGHSKK